MTAVAAGLSRFALSHHYIRRSSTKLERIRTMLARITWRYLLLLGAGVVGAICSPNARSLSPSASPGVSATQSAVSRSYRVPRSFEENQGQTTAQVRFLSRGSGYTLFLTSTEAVMSLRRPHGVPMTVRVRPLGANPAPRVSGESQLPTTVNYVGASPEQALTGIATYSRVRYDEVYPGVDLIYYDNGQQLEYDFIVAPNGDPDRIRLQFAGVETMSVDAAGSLVLGGPMGELRQPAPVVYQEVDGDRRTVSGSYVVDGADQIRFQLGDYDRTRPLVIDPVLAYSTVLWRQQRGKRFGYRGRCRRQRVHIRCLALDPIGRGV